MKPLSIIDALKDPALFGGLEVFRDLTSWKPWLAFLSALYGLKMSDEDLELFRKHTGRDKPQEDGYAEGTAIVGCQSGKSQIAELVGVYEAARAVLQGEQGLYVPLVAQNLRGAQRALFRFTQEAVAGSPVLSREVTRETADTLRFGVWPRISSQARPTSLSRYICTTDQPRS